MISAFHFASARKSLISVKLKMDRKRASLYSKVDRIFSVLSEACSSWHAAMISS